MHLRAETRYIVVLVKVLLCSVFMGRLNAQSVFNRTYIEDRPTMLFSSVVAINDTFFTLGVSTGSPNNTAKGLLCKIDESGEFVSKILIGDTINANYGLFWNSLIQSTDGKLVFVGYCYDSVPSILVGVSNLQIDTVHLTRHYSLSESGFQAYSILQYDDSTYYLTGGCARNANVDAVLMKLDAAGGKIWERYYDSRVYDFGKKIIKLSNNKILLGCERNDLNQTNERANTWLLEVDTGGNIVRQWFDPNDSTYAAEGLRQTQDGGFIYGGKKKVIQIGVTIGYANSLVKVDSNFNEQWVYETGYRSIYSGFTDVEELSDGSFVVCGQMFVLNRDTNVLYGCVSKFSRTGNLVWERTYQGVNATNSLNFLSDIDVLPDGGLIAVGQCQLSGATPPQVGWFLKLDSNGCVVDNCLVGVDDRNERLDNREMQVWPNPASGTFKVKLPDDMQGVELRVYDVTGHVVKDLTVSGFEFTVDVGNLTKGLYLVTVQTAQGQVVKKVVKE